MEWLETYICFRGKHPNGRQELEVPWEKLHLSLLPCSTLKATFTFCSLHSKCKGRYLKLPKPPAIQDIVHHCCFCCCSHSALQSHKTPTRQQPHPCPQQRLTQGPKEGLPMPEELHEKLWWANGARERRIEHPARADTLSTRIPSVTGPPRTITCVHIN